jgi:hypothetical protein
LRVFIHFRFSAFAVHTPGHAVLHCKG